MQTILVTGANRGIGLEHVGRFVARGSKVFAAVRNPNDAPELQSLADEAKGQVTIIAYDAADPKAPAAIAAAVGGASIDLLLNNAGIYGGDSQTLQDFSPEAFLQTLSTNTLAPLALTIALLPAIKRSEKRLIANQSSRMGSIGDNGGGGFYAYRASKAALNMVTMSLAQDLKADGVTVIALHPGWVKTRMGGPSAPVAPADSVAGQQALFERVTIKDTGGFFDFSGAVLPW